MAYAVVVSLKQTLEPLLDSGRSRIRIPNLVLKLIYEDLCYLKSFFDKINSLEDSNSVEELEKQIKDVVQNSRDLIESHLSDIVHPGDESSISGFSRKMVEVKGKLGSLIKMLKAKEDYLTGDQQSPDGLGRNKKIVGLADVAGSSRIDFGRNNKIVGLEDEVIMLKQLLYRANYQLQVISIIGMVGVGKTTLVKEVYLDPLTFEYFDIRLFVKIDLEYELEELLLHLLGQVISKDWGSTVDELGESLHKYLYGRRYLVVLDGIRDTWVWSELRMFFPDNSNGSAIILTTRMTDVARDNVLQKRFLNNKESWELLCKMAFSDMEECPAELVEMGKTIVQNLGGLPLAIVMIAKLLSVSERTLENWMAVAQNIRESTIPTILNLSYTQLPQRLKACFLYLGLFPPNYNIPTAQLIKLWVSEGFIEPVTDKSLEQSAEEYLEDLVSRSLVLVDELSSTGRIKTCRIHQLLQDVCVNEARQQKLFHIVNEGTASSREVTHNQRRLGIQSDVVPGVESVSGARSLVFILPQHQHPLQVFVFFRWLRVLHALSIIYGKFPDEVLKLVRLRYLAITCDGELPSSISRLWNLEVLIIHPSQSIKSYIFLPLEIWKLQRLRHLDCMGFDLPDPSTGHGNDLYLENLLTLSGVSDRSCSEGVLARMPNLIKLGIWLEPTDPAVEISCFDAVSSNLYQLESFKCAVMNPSEAAFSKRKVINLIFSRIRFPSRLKKLTLSGCGFMWNEHMTSISRLPNLQTLKLRWHAFSGRVWEFDEWGFFRLKYLLLEDLDIKFLIAKSDHFPVLEHLLIRRCYELQEIPFGFGYIPTLQIIEVDHCSRSLIKSARRMQEELGNEDLQFWIHHSLFDDDVQMTNSNDATYGSFNDTDSSTYNSDLEEKYLRTAELGSTSDTKMTPALVQRLSNDVDCEIPLKTISQLQEDEKSGEFWVYATISSLEKIGASAYLACKLCFTELEPNDDKFFCDRCNTYDIGGRMRYILTLRVIDESGTAAFHLWDYELLALITETAYELNKDWEVEELLMAIESLTDKKALFKVLVKEGQTKKFTGAYSVTKVISESD